MGWFFGFKLHIVINHLGELLSFTLTPGNVDDRKLSYGFIVKGWWKNSLGTEVIFHQTFSKSF